MKFCILLLLVAVEAIRLSEYDAKNQCMRQSNDGDDEGSYQGQNESGQKSQDQSGKDDSSGKDDQQPSSNSTSGWFSGSASHYGEPSKDSFNSINLPQNPPTCISSNKLGDKLEWAKKLKAEYMIGAPDDLHPEIWGDGDCGSGDTPKCENQQSCGQCYEVKCVAKLKAGEWKLDDMSDKSSCTGKSVAVMIVDGCPHNHHFNRQKTQNKEYNPCGGDFPNLDLGWKAFQRIANVYDGNIHAEFRKIDCSEMEAINSK